MIRSRTIYRKCSLSLLAAALVIFGAIEGIQASTLGSVPFAYFKAAATAALFAYTSIGARVVAAGTYTSGQQTFVFGSGSGSDGLFNSSEGAAIDSANNLMYVADTGNNRIVKITLSTGAVIGSIGRSIGTTGTCPANGVAPGWCTGGYFVTTSADGGYSAPHRVAVDATGTYLYVTDLYRVIKINASTGAFVGAIGRTTASTGTCPASGTAPGWCTGGTFGTGAVDGEFNGPRGLAVDGTHLYITEYWNDRVVKVNASTGAFVGAIGLTNATSGTCPASGAAPGWCTGGSFTNGGGDGRFSGPTGVAVDATNGFIFVVDALYRIQKFDSATGAFVGAVGRSGASTGTCTANAVATSWCTGGSFTSSSLDGGIQTGYDVAVDVTNGLLFMVDANNASRLTKRTLSTGAFVGSVGRVTTSTGTCPASAVATGWCTGGTFTRGTPDGYFYTPFGVAADTGGNVFVVDTGNNRIVKINSSTGAWGGALGGIYSFATWSSGLGLASMGSLDGVFDSPSSVAVDGANGYLYVAENQTTGRISKINLATGAFIGGVGRTSTPSYGTCPASSTATTWCTGVDFLTGTGDGQYSLIRGLALDSTGTYLYISEFSNNRIVKINAATGTFVGAIGRTTATSGTCPASGAASGWCTGGTFSSGAGDGMFNGPRGVAVDSAKGFLYVSDYSNFRVQKFNLSTGAFVGAIGRTSATSGTCPASGVTTGWCTGGTFVTGTSDGMFSAPQQLAVDNTGENLFIPDEGSDRVLKYNAETGVYIGTIGRVTATSGTCPATGATPGWCTGGTFAAGSFDGSHYAPRSVATDSSYIYVTNTNSFRVSKFNAQSGKFIGSIGKTSSTSGTCPASGAATKWCTGGGFASGVEDGAFTTAWGIAVDTHNGGFYITDSAAHRIVRVK